MVALAKWEMKKAHQEAAKKRAEEEAEYRRTHKKREIRPLIPVQDKDQTTSKIDDADGMSAVSAVAETPADLAISMQQAPRLSRQDNPPDQDGKDESCRKQEEMQESETFNLTNQVRVGQQLLMLCFPVQCMLIHMLFPGARHSTFWRLPGLLSQQRQSSH